jgi:hypothetical protein
VAGYGRKSEDCVHRDGSRATKACLQYPVSLAVDSSGNLFIGEIVGYVGKLDVGNGLISTVVGGGHSGKTVEGSSALSADFWSIDSLAIGDEGNLCTQTHTKAKVSRLTGRAGSSPEWLALGNRASGETESLHEMPVFGLQTPCLWTKLATY